MEGKQFNVEMDGQNEEMIDTMEQHEKHDSDKEMEDSEFHNPLYLANAGLT